MIALLALVVAIGALLYAGAQLRSARTQIEQGADQLRISAGADLRAAAADESRTRPYVTVNLELTAKPSSDPKKEWSEGVAFIVIQNAGQTPATDLRLTVTPGFQTSGKGKTPGEPDSVKETLDNVFSGEIIMGMLALPNRLRYLLDFTSEVMDPDGPLPKRYDIQAHYWNAEHDAEYTTTSVIEFAALAMTIPEVKPLEIIARQFRRFNERSEK